MLSGTLISDEWRNFERAHIEQFAVSLKYS